MSIKNYLTLYLQLLTIRYFEEKIAAVYKEQKIRCPVHLSIGQEAVAVGVCDALEKTDYVMSTHRSHAHYIAKGGDLTRLGLELFGHTGGCASGIGGSMHLIDLSVGFLGSTPIVGGTLPIAVGTAFGRQLKQEDGITVVFFGDGAVEEGVLHESLNFAVLKQLPVLFVCENNLYSVNSPMTVRQPQKRQILDIARGHGINGEWCDGQDTLTLNSRAMEIVQKMKDQPAPYFLECSTYRFKEHCGPNEDIASIRTAEELAFWQLKCPVNLFETYLLNHTDVSQSDINQHYKSIQDNIDFIFNHVSNQAFERNLDLSTYVYKENR